MKDKLCPQCKIRRFQVKNENGDFIVVTVNQDNEIIPIHDQTCLDGYDLSTVYCLGCSWSGSLKSLI